MMGSSSRHPVLRHAGARADALIIQRIAALRVRVVHDREVRTNALGQRVRQRAVIAEVNRLGQVRNGAGRVANERAHRVARKLIGAGFARGDRLLITADTWPGFFDTFFGCQYAGLIPVPVSIPVGIGGKEAYLDQLRRQFAASGAVAAVGLDDLAGFLADAAKEFPAVRLHGGLGVIDALPEPAIDLRPLGPDDLCYIQFSSGSTRHPHGIQIMQSALMANLDGMTGPAGLGVVPGDRAVSWLPLYHDMGLIGFLMAPLSSQLSIDYLTPRDFARRPMQWLNIISKNRGTISYSPSFGYDLAVRRGAAQVPARALPQRGEARRS